MNDARTTNADNFSLFTRRALLVIFLIILALFLWQVRIVLILAFAGTLLAVILHNLAKLLSRHTPLSREWALAAVGVGILALIAGFIMLLGPQISSQINQLVQSLPNSMKTVQAELSKTSWGSYLLQQIQSSSKSSGAIGTLGRMTGAASVLLNVLTDSILVIFLGIFFAISPGLYKRGMLMLVPQARRQRAEEALDAVGNALWRWLIGKLVAMVAVGVLVGVGLAIIGAPLPLVLGLIAGIFDFVTFIGPLAAAVPGILLSLSEGPTTALLATGIYFLVQQIEGNIITPLVQEKTVELAPALTILATIGFGLVFGIPGLIIGTPLAVVLLVLTKMLYVEDTLHDRTHVPGRD